jgi:hypothetical protein
MITLTTSLTHSLLVTQWSECWCTSLGAQGLILGMSRDTLSDLFPINDKTHKMQTRDDEVYKVKFANTNRLKHSSIVTMQNMLNDDARKK